MAKTDILYMTKFVKIENPKKLMDFKVCCNECLYVPDTIVFKFIVTTKCDQ